MRRSFTIRLRLRPILALGVLFMRPEIVAIIGPLCIEFRLDY
jgi:hypothetical protein